MKRINIGLALALIFLDGCVGGVLFGPPVVETVTLSPNPATAGERLTCVYEGYAGGTDLSDITWTINGIDAGVGSTLEDGFVRDDVVGCEVTPSNGNRDGEPVSASVTIENAAPVLSEVTLSPAAPTSSDALFCDYAPATDADGDEEISYTVTWSVNDQLIAQSGQTLSASSVERDDTVQCHVIANDGEDDSAFIDSAIVDIDNSPPTVVGLAIDPPSPLFDDTLTCDYTSFEDADDDPDQSSLKWTVNGVNAGAGPLLDEDLAKDDVVTCTVTPYDGLQEGGAVTVSVTVLGPNDCDDDGDGYWAASAASLECEVLEETNYYRSVGYNCDTEGYFGPTGPLTMQHQLRKAARYHSKWMSDTGTFSHDSPGGPYGDDFVDRIEWAGYTGWSLVGENIAAGYTTPEEVVLGWMKSDGHCRNIMKPGFTEIGIGYFYDSGSDYKHWWSQEFGAR